MKSRLYRITASALTVLAFTGATMLGAVGSATAAGSTTTPAVTGFRVSDDPSPSDQDSLRQIAAAIWNQSLADGWDMNSDVADVLSQATQAILTCSTAFSLVPKPPGWQPGLWYLVTYVKNIVYYFQAVNGSRTYQACISGTALNFRSAIEIASTGV